MFCISDSSIFLLQLQHHNICLKDNDKEIKLFGNGPKSKTIYIYINMQNDST